MIQVYCSYISMITCIRATDIKFATRSSSSVDDVQIDCLCIILHTLVINFLQT